VTTFNLIIFLSGCGLLMTRTNTTGESNASCIAQVKVLQKVTNSRMVAVTKRIRMNIPTLYGTVQQAVNGPTAA